MPRFTHDDLEAISDAYIALSRSLDNASPSKIKRMKPALLLTQEIITSLASVLVGRSAITLTKLKSELVGQTTKLKALKTELENLKAVAAGVQALINAFSSVFSLVAAF